MVPNNHNQYYICNSKTFFIEIYIYFRNTDSRPEDLDAPKLEAKIDSHYDINVNRSTIGVDLLGILFGELQNVSKRFPKCLKCFKNLKNFSIF